MAKYKVFLMVILATVCVALVAYGAVVWSSHDSHNAYQECLETWADMPQDIAEQNCIGLM